MGPFGIDNVKAIILTMDVGSNPTGSIYRTCGRVVEGTGLIIQLLI